MALASETKRMPKHPKAALILWPLFQNPPTWWHSAVPGKANGTSVLACLQSSGPYLPCAEEFCQFCFLSSRNLGKRWASTGGSEGHLLGRQCGSCSSHLCSSEVDLRHVPQGPGSPQGSSLCKPSSEESWGQTGQAVKWRGSWDIRRVWPGL